MVFNQMETGLLQKNEEKKKMLKLEGFQVFYFDMTA